MRSGKRKVFLGVGLAALMAASVLLAGGGRLFAVEEPLARDSEVLASVTRGGGTVTVTAPGTMYVGQEADLLVTFSSEEGLTNLVRANFQVFDESVLGLTSYGEEKIISTYDSGACTYPQVFEPVTITTSIIARSAGYCKINVSTLYTLSGNYVCSLDDGEDPILTFYIRVLDRVNMQDVQLDVGESKQMKVSVESAEVAKPTGTWASSDTKIATVNASGLVTGVKPGSATISFTDAQSGDTIQARATVNPFAVTLSPANASIDEESTQQLTVTFPQTYKGDKAGTWKVDKPSVAKVDAKGLVKGLAPGTATITFTHTATGATATATITVRPVSITLAISPQSAGVYVGNYQSFFITATPTRAASEGSWASSNPAVATVNGSGVATGVSPGNATITFTHAKTGMRASATLSVYNRPAPLPTPAPNPTPIPTPTPPPVVTDPPTIQGDAQIALPEGYTSSVVPYTIGGTSPTVTISFDGGTGALIKNDGKLLIPAGLPVGTYALTITASNSAGTVNYPVTLVIFPNVPSIVGADSLLTYVGSPATSDYVVSGAPSTTVAISTEAGENTANATLTGAYPNVTLNVPGTLPVGHYVATIVATSNGTTIKKAVAVDVSPVIAVTSTPSAPTCGVNDSTFNIFLTASGGTGPYTYALAPGSAFPGSWSIGGDMIYSMAPNTLGTHTFTIVATDDDGWSGTVDITVTVVP